MIARVQELLYLEATANDSDIMTWAERLAFYRKRPHHWLEDLLENPDRDWSRFGEDAPMMVEVFRLAWAFAGPPEEVSPPPIRVRQRTRG
jgi:hypothetical protein